MFRRSRAGRARRVDRGAGERGFLKANRSVTSEPVRLWGLSLAPVTRAGAADALSARARGDRPSYVITANVHYAMLTAESPELAR